jgi:hypothetical protein
MDTEEQLRNRVTTTWAALQSAKGASKDEVEAFRRYCEALSAASTYAAAQVKLAREGGKGNAMQLALRVLAAINNRQAPDALDVEALRAVWPNAIDRGADEVACEVIQQEMLRRAKARAAGSD